MGFDCHLHVVPIAELERFGAWFLDPTEVVVAGQSLGERRAAVVEAIEADGSKGARALLELMIRYVTRDTPHKYSRGFCLSTWDYPAEFVGADLPSLPGSVFDGDVFEWLGDVAKAHPALASDEARRALQGPFRHNYDVGCFVPAERIPELRAFVEKVLAGLEEQHELLDPLLEVLRLAERKGMAYWEHTDLPVENRNESWFDELRAPSAGGVSTWEPSGCAYYLGGTDPLYVGELVPGDALHVHAVDPGGAPLVSSELFRAPYYQPDSTTMAGHVALLTVDGRVDLIDPAGNARVLVERNEYRAGAVHPLGDRFLLAPTVYSLEKGWVTQTLTLDGTLETWDLVAAAAECGETLDYRHGHQLATFPLGDGTHVLRWEDKLYRIQGRRIERLGRAIVERPHWPRGKSRPVPTWVNPEPGKVCFVSGESAICVDAKGTISRPYRKVDKVTHVARGKGDSVLFGQRKGRKGPVFSIAEADGKIVRVGPDVLGDGKGDLSGLGYSEAADAVFVVRENGPSLVVPWSLCSG